MIVLDASGSIGGQNFESVREYVLQYVDSLTIGPNDNRVGVITFSGSARLEFGLGAYNNRASLKQAVRNIHYTGGSTNIPTALVSFFSVFSV